jgi:hypothetical protein
MKKCTACDEGRTPDDKHCGNCNGTGFLQADAGTSDAPPDPETGLPPVDGGN